jgi:hypothetical protein
MELTVTYPFYHKQRGRTAHLSLMLRNAKPNKRPRRGANSCLPYRKLRTFPTIDMHEITPARKMNAISLPSRRFRGITKLLEIGFLLSLSLSL